VGSERNSTTSGIVDDAHGAWKFLQCRPAHLAALIDHAWVFDGTMTSLRERTFPNGLLEIIVHIGDRYRVVDERGSSLCPAVCMTGVQLQHLVVEAPPVRTKVIGIRLTPAGAYAILGRPMHEIAGLTVDLEDVAGLAAAELAIACDRATTLEACARVAVEWVERQIGGRVGLAPVVSWMVAQIRGRSGNVSIGQLREQTGWSKARLASVFAEQVGVTPKYYARIIRFNRALKLIHAETEAFADVAASSGYYDQSHLNAEFRELSGFTPSEFQQAYRYPNSISVADA
jgi:AraC-like DNA-binding protein